jgi:hypothetical protein
MSSQEKNNLWKYAAVAAVAFFFGKEYADTPAQPAPAQSPYTLSSPAPATAADGVASAPVEAEEAPAVYYARCADARAAGAAPIRVGEPGYAPHLDRDGDGIACE